MSYFDTSVLVAYYVPELLSPLAQHRLATTDIAIVSELAQIELVSALSLRHRNGDLRLIEVEQISNLLFDHLENDLYRTIHLDSETYQLARTYLARFDLPLKAPDALHLAAASQTQTTLITADRQLARNAEALDISVDLLVATSK